MVMKRFDYSWIARFGNGVTCRRFFSKQWVAPFQNTSMSADSQNWWSFSRLMKNVSVRCHRGFAGLVILLLALNGNRLRANPTGGTVTQGSATFSSSGSQFNINQSSANALINWQSFNIGAGETVNFNQPSSSSVTWNQINDSNPSQILGSLNANGYVILQNSSGFFVGGQASITAHGLIMTTASTPTLNLGSGGPWSFDTPPPTAKIVNYGQINIAGDGPAYLIANDIENNGTISAPGGKIGLYAGQSVLVSTSPDGRGLSAEATVPQGLVDNNGNLVANAGNITLKAQMVNQNGLIQANSAEEVNGTVELVGSDSVNLGANSVVSAQGDTQGTSSGGSVTIQGGNSFSDQAGSVINVAGGAQGGNGGQVEISAPQMGDINSTINGWAADGFSGGILTIDPANLWLASASTDPTAPSGYSVVNVNSFSGLSQISLQADNNITLNTPWTLADQTADATLSLSAGNNITLNNGSSIQAGQNWSVNLTAGTAYSRTTRPASGNDGIYLDGNAYIQSQNADINLYAANEVQVGWSGQSTSVGIANSGSGAIRTLGGGNINVTAEYGDVNSGSSPYGFIYAMTAPYTSASSSLGGISTANGGNVTINAGDNVVSFPAANVAPNPSSNAGYTDAGTGAFGSAPGNVTINAGGNVYGCYVVMNGMGAINAENIGTSVNNVALSLSTGGWNLNAQASVYLQEVRNPNGDFNTTTISRINHNPSAANHLFTYDPQASLTLTAGNAVYLTGYELPRPDGGVPLLLPPVVTINAGPGGVVLDTPTATDGNSANDVTLSDADITLFPSSYQNLAITTTGGGWLSSGNANGTIATLLMSDSGLTQWYNTASGGSAILPFGENDHASTPALLNNDNPVSINLSGSQLVNGIPVLAGMENVVLQTDKATQINVAGDMIGCSFYGENLQATGPGSVTSINVGGQIVNAGSFTSVTLADDLPTLPAADTPFASELPPGTSLSSWYLALALSVDPSKLPSRSLAGVNLSQLLSYINSATTFPGLDLNDLVYNPNTKTLTAIGPMSSTLADALESPTLTVVRFGANGYPMLDSSGHFVLDTINWMSGNNANASLISTLYDNSEGNAPLGSLNGAYVVGGSGQFNVTAGSISLGNSLGILSVGNGTASTRDYSFLAPYITSGANINVQVKSNPAISDADGSLVMPASTIASLGGGSITVDCNGEIPNSLLNDNGVGVSMDLGSQDLLSFESQIINAHNLGLGIYTTGGGNVNVTAAGTINVDSSRIATFDGGDVTVESLTGDVNAGSGGAAVIPVYYYAPDYSGAHLVEIVPANGIMAGTLTAARQIPPDAVRLPGNVTVITDQGNIYANAGGISQVAYDEILSAASGSTTITLIANGSPGLDQGNIVLGSSGVIGVNVVAKATGSITGLIISQQNADISTGQNFAGTVLSGGKTTLSSPGTISGTIIAAGGVNTSGGGNLTATVLTTSVNGGAGTLATSSSASSASQSAAGQTSNEAQQQVASNSDDEGKKKKKKKTELVRTVGRVTVILPNAS
jgi:filamentous hemagglutinin family protein